MPIEPEYDNPFSTPREPPPRQVRYGTGTGLQVSGKEVVVGHRAHLPSRCYICNADERPGGRRMAKKVYYVPGWIYLLLLVNILVLLIGYLATRKGPVDLQYSLCARHRGIRNRRIFTVWVLFFASILCFYIAVDSHSTASGWFGAALFLGFLISAVVASQGPRPTKHLNGKFWISGCGPSFLHSLQAERQGGEDD